MQQLGDHARRLHAWVTANTKAKEVFSLGPSDLMKAGRALDLSLNEVMAAREDLVRCVGIPPKVTRHRFASPGLAALDGL